MDEQSYYHLRTDAEQALLDYRLYDALACLQGILYDTGEPQLLREHESLKCDYERMLQFMSAGGTDPQRNEIHRQLIRRAFALLDNAGRIFKRTKTSCAYAMAYRQLCDREETDLEKLSSRMDQLCDSLAEERNRHDYNERTARIRELEAVTAEASGSLFNRIWTANCVNRDEEETMRSIIERQEEHYRPFLISALTLNLWEGFNAGIYRILLYFCLSTNVRIRTRALTAAIWGYMKYRTRFTYYPDLLKGLSLLGQEPPVANELLILQKQLFLSLETIRAKKKLQEEILPDLLKSKRYQRNKMGFEEIDTDLADALRGTPPENWKPTREDMKLANNMKEFMQMGEEGIDVNLATFSALKSFDFFRKVSNWFLPFDSRHPDVRDLFFTDEDKPMQFPHFLLQTGNFCESDKYSLCLMLQRIPKSQRTAVMDKFGAQIEAAGKDEALHERMQQAETPERQYRSYIEDLYRFFKLYPSHHEFTDPFANDLLFTRYEVLKEMTDTPTYRKEMAEFLMKLGYYADAITFWEALQSTEGATADLLQKLAYCQWKNKMPGKAVLTYQQADLLSPDNEWVLNQLHLCYSELGRFDKELECLLKLEEMSPENVQVISETGFCLMQLHRFEEAANRFYKLEYLGKRVLPSLRAIAWCAFKMNKLKQAEKYYTKILETGEKAKWEDYLNAGHTAWLLGDLKKAIGLYKQYIERYGKQFPDKKNWLQPFNEDIQELTAHGLSLQDICLMRDIIQPYSH